MTCPDESTLLLMADRSLPRDAEHLDRCGICSTTVAELEDTMESLRSAAPAGSNHTMERAMRIAAVARPPQRWIPLVAAAAVIAATVLAFVLMPEKKRAIAPVDPAPVAPAPQQEDKTPEILRARAAAVRDALVEKGGGGKAAPKTDKVDAEAEKRIRKLLELLSDESAEIRESASSALAKFGEGARALLEEQAAKASDADVRERCKALAAKIGVGTTEDWVRDGLTWLTKNQLKGGSWGGVGTTGLALLAYFGAGEGTASKTHGRAVRDGLAFLLSQQGEDGGVRDRTEPKQIYDHAIATWVLVEAAKGGYAGDDEPKIKAAAQSAVDFLVNAQNPGKGWRYSPKCGDNDSSVTYWAGSALGIAKRLGFAVPDQAFDGARAWFDSVGDPAFGTVGYTHKGTGKVFIPGANEQYSHHTTLAAAATAFRLYAGDAADAGMEAQVRVCLNDAPATGNSADYYYWHIATQAAFQLHGPASKEWKGWAAALTESIKETRAPDGSWEPTDRWGVTLGAGGRAYATTINLLTLQTFYRYPVLKK